MNHQRPLSLLAAVLASSASFAQIPNGGFEQWTNMGGFDDPDGWTTNNALSTSFGAQPTCEWGTPAPEGAKFLKVTTRYAAGMGTLNGHVMTEDGGFPFVFRPASLEGLVQFYPQGDDDGHILVTLSKWNPLTQTREEFADGFMEWGSTVSTWQNFSIPITYYTSDHPDTASIQIISSAALTTDSTTIWVDGLSFVGEVGLAEVDRSDDVVIFPVPASGTLNIRARSSIEEILIVDLLGRTAGSVRPSSNSIALEIDHLPAGSYALRVRFNDKSIGVRTFMKQ